MPRLAIQKTIKEALAAAAASFSKAGFPSAWLDAELLLSHVLKKERSFLLTRPEISLTARQHTIFSELINKRLKHHPVAYLLGHKEFYGLDFIVTPDVLVPRPESELIVDLAKNLGGPDTLLIDVGTGSGCLPITLAPYFASVIALDISPKALLVARKNGRKHGRKNIKFMQSDLLSAPLDSKSSLGKYSNIIITANLPYLTAAEIKNEKSIGREPRLALYGGKDGLDLYRKLAKQLDILSRQNVAIPITLFCEINPKQKQELTKIWQNHKTTLYKDLNSQTRIGKIIL